MARKADKKPVTAQMYRHFAAVTLAATVALAMFSSGESGEAVAREVAAAKESGLEVSDELPLAEATTSASSSAGGGTDVAFGTPTSPVGGIGTVSLGSLGGSGIGVPANYTKYGVSAAEWERLTPEQRKKLKEKFASEKQAAGSDEREQQVESLLARSAARSTGSTDFAD